MSSNVRVSRDGRRIDVSAIGASHAEQPSPEPEPDPEEPEPEPPDPSQMDIEEVPGVKQARVVPLIDPAWAHLSGNIGAIMRAHASLRPPASRRPISPRSSRTPWTSGTSRPWPNSGPVSCRSGGPGSRS
jgi:hypothetical protein